ncbi:MAG: phosphoribosyl-AMP cyclohydrolase [Actinomycetota bacterium]
MGDDAEDLLALSVDEVLARVRFDSARLVPAIAQDSTSRQVLMLAWMNEEALRATMTTRRATYFSRSRQGLWVKGETSGNSQQVMQLRLDCDGDALLLLVEQQGPACHTGEQSCFDVGGTDVR